MACSAQRPNNLWPFITDLTAQITLAEYITGSNPSAPFLPHTNRTWPPPSPAPSLLLPHTIRTPDLHTHRRHPADVSLTQPTPWPSLPHHRRHPVPAGGRRDAPPPGPNPHDCSGGPSAATPTPEAPRSAALEGLWRPLRAWHRGHRLRVQLRHQRPCLQHARQLRHGPPHGARIRRPVPPLALLRPRRPLPRPRPLVRSPGPHLRFLSRGCCSTDYCRDRSLAPAAMPLLTDKCSKHIPPNLSASIIQL